jgi:hypothetical protein
MTISAVLLFAALIVAVLLWQKLMGKARAGATRAIARGSHRAGQALVREPVRFQVPVAPAEVAQAVVATVNAYAQPPALVPGLFLRENSVGRLRFVFGSKVNEVFVADVVLASAANGTTGRFDVVSWTESDGLVAHRAEIARLRDRVSAAVAGLGGDVSAPAGSPR